MRPDAPGPRFRSWYLAYNDFLRGSSEPGPEQGLGGPVEGSVTVESMSLVWREEDEVEEGDALLSLERRPIVDAGSIGWLSGCPETSDLLGRSVFCRLGS